MSTISSNKEQSQLKNTIIAVSDLKKIYLEGTPGEVQALRGVNLHIEQGEFVAIMGASGSGKSTLLNILGCMDKASSGSVKIGGYEINGVAERQLSQIRKKDVGFIFQDVFLLDNLSALDNVLAPLIPYGITKADRKRAEDLLTKAGLQNRMNHKPNEMSGGQKQRVAVCRALINEPLIVLADEPTGNLDSKIGAEIMNFLKSLNEEKRITFIVVTHDPKVADYTSRLIRFEDGQIIEDTSVSSL